MRRIILLSSLVLLALPGCKVSKVRDIIKDYDYKNNYQLINASSEPVDIHIGAHDYTGKAPAISNSKYLVASLEAGQDSVSVRVKRDNIDYRVSVQSFQRLNKNGSNHWVYDVKNDDDQTVVAWQDNNAPQISAFKKQSSDQNGVYRLRFFAVSSGIEIKAGSSVQVLEKGQPSNWFSVQNCNGDFSINGKAVDVCKATAGQSFLLVVDADKVRSLNRS
ncbi:MAG: hypothetical protein KJ930_02605 [Gammaproteobacteria bacterium]|jgi:hypothetical protein|nr:hypothetical protein [Gammaproteobacteria bacterium]MBU2178301.1 hypothetical protein [Gammaproteobacteria bacterium]MBU2277160.1 hypothetical protein [Gammaproteobacteria bacterium]MBU2426752.1 hypothetical protein [Gammaproteobacteria bacterium]